MKAVCGDHGTTCGPNCEDWVTVNVLELSENYWFATCGDSEPVLMRYTVTQELRGVTCVANNDSGGWFEEFKPPYRRRMILSADVEI